MTDKLIEKALAGKSAVIVVTRSPDDADKMEQVLRDLGISCLGSSPRRPDTEAIYVSQTSHFWFKGAYSMFLEYPHLSPAQFISLFNEQLLYSPGEKSLHARFNDLSERVDRLTALVEKIAAEILTKSDIDKGKPGLKS